jgi:hypothetical protein
VLSRIFAAYGFNNTNATQMNTLIYGILGATLLIGFILVQLYLKGKHKHIAHQVKPADKLRMQLNAYAEYRKKLQLEIPISISKQ